MTTPFPPDDEQQARGRGWAAPDGSAPSSGSGAGFTPQDDVFPPQRRVDPQVPHVGVVPLRPMSFGEIFEGAFRVLKFNPRTMFGTSFVALAGVALVMVVLTAVFAMPLLAGSSGQSVGGPAAGNFSTTTNLISGGMSLATFLLSGLLLPPVVDAVRGNRMSPGTAWAHVRGRLLALVGYGILSVLITAALLVVPLGLAGWLVFATFQSQTPDSAAIAELIGGALLFLALLVLISVAVATYLSLAAPAIVLERVGPVTGIRRSVTLVRGSFWRILLILLVANLIVSLISGTVFALVTAIGVGVLGASGVDPASVTAIGIGGYALVMVLVNTFTLPFSATVTGLVYLDRRYRTEGLAVDLARDSQQATPGRQ